MSKLILTLGVPATTPSTGQLALYAKTDGKLYVKNDSGTEAVIGAPTTDVLQGPALETILQGINSTTPVNNLNISNSDTGSHPTISAVGADAAVNIALLPKGAGTIDMSNSIVTGVANPTNPSDAMNLAYAAINYADTGHDHTGVYSVVAHDHTDMLHLVGGVMTGAITLAGDPVNVLEASTKQYVDSYVNTAGGTIKIQDIVGAMVSGNTESAVNVTYDNILKKLDFGLWSYDLTLAGDVTGVVSLGSGLSSTLTCTVADDSHSHDALYYNKPATDAAILAQVSIAGVLVRTAAGPVALTTSNHVVVINQTVAAAIIVTLPAGATVGKMIQIKDGKGDAATNNITVNGAATDTIDGAPAVVMNSNYQNLSLLWNGTEWNLL